MTDQIDPTDEDEDEQQDPEYMEYMSGGNSVGESVKNYSVIGAWIAVCIVFLLIFAI